ncbi:MAG: SNF2-related protein [Bacteroidota bacterium]
MQNIQQAIYYHLQNNFNRMIFNRGQRVFQNQYVLDLQYSREEQAFKAIVESESGYADEYFVDIYFDKTDQTFQHSCTCLYGFSCKHIVATFIRMLHELKSGELTIEINPANHRIDIDSFDEERVIALSGPENFKTALKIADRANNTLNISKPGKAEYLCTVSGKKYTVNLDNAAYTNQIHTACNCKDTEYSLCLHKTAALLKLKEEYGPYGLFDTHDYSKDYERILSQIGLTPDDNYHEVVRFAFKDGSLIGYVVNDNFLDPRSSKAIKESLENNHNPLQTLPEKAGGDFITGYLLNFSPTTYEDSHFELKALIGKKSKKSDRMIGRIEATEFPWENEHWKKTADENDYRIAELCNTYSPNIKHIDESEALIHKLHSIAERSQGKRLFARIGDLYYSHIRATELQPVSLSPEPVKAKAQCTLQKPYIKVKFTYLINDKEVKLHKAFDQSGFFIENANSFHLWRSGFDFFTLGVTGKNHEILIPEKHWDEVWFSWLRKLANHISFEFEDTFNPIHEIMVNETNPRVYLKEEGNFLLIYPAISYDQNDVYVLSPGEQHFTADNKLIKRDRQQEQELIEQIASTHKSFNANTFQPFFYIPAEKVLEKMWFLNFYELCKRQNIEVFGLEKLKQVKYYPARPSIKYGVKSGTDWFDIQMTIAYDNYQVSLADIRKAILKKSDYILLDNNKFAMLPDEWMKRFSAALRFGKVADDGIRLKKNQFALIHELYDEINDVEVQRELAEKKALLNGRDGIDKIRKPRTITAKMRDYQAEGLNWLCYLHKTSLGGCLADDMGLGKTLQMLALFAWAKGQNPGKKLTNLVVCPTSLIDNWNNEIEKFAPSFNTVLHWGPGRDSSSKNWKKADVVVTSYGTLVNDIEWMRKFKFHIATLDESQAIKNTGSLRYKAVNLINAAQRYVMTGTPIENSTLELYAQMNFVNPGILGSLNGFRNDFASSIEKDRDENKIMELKKLVSPFIIRRKKEDVAKELPPKTEQVLICEMEEEQRKIYEAFRQEIRNSIMHEIEQEGINKSRFHVLEGLTKLRQICDSPHLLNTTEDDGKASVKADELIRYITEKIRDHKALVFSQFLGMLSLIEERLQQHNIKYVKLTGSSTKRGELVEAFENDDSCRVFLISLKAGGTGLNLVSADYVFMVDPWWNPAVENQAIDRTHRIGQTKKVFAYRMICKDTIEEKIIHLQKKKQALADDIIDSDKGFVSKLTKEDLENLLS